MDEFSLIRQYCYRDYPDVPLGVGDDAALIQVREGHHLVVSVDAMVEGKHFFPGTDPKALGHKSLAVNLSDMAAMGALPRWATVCLTLPQADSAWLDRFYEGLWDLAEQYEVRLIGGDTNQGPLNISIQILGEVPIQQAITRAGAKVGEDIWVSGELGLAAMAVDERYGQLTLSKADSSLCAQRLDYPMPRIVLGSALKNIATAMLDVSDGLLADMAHIGEQSNVGAVIQADLLPSSSLQGTYPVFLEKQLTGGDDYELCFTAPFTQRNQIKKLSIDLNIPLHQIGKIVPAAEGIRCLLPDGTVWKSANRKNGQLGFEHFTE